MLRCAANLPRPVIGASLRSLLPRRRCSRLKRCMMSTCAAKPLAALAGPPLELWQLENAYDPAERGDQSGYAAHQSAASDYLFSHLSWRAGKYLPDRELPR